MSRPTIRSVFGKASFSTSYPKLTYTPVGLRVMDKVFSYSRVWQITPGLDDKDGQTFYLHNPLAALVRDHRGGGLRYLYGLPASAGAESWVSWFLSSPTAPVESLSRTIKPAKNTAPYADTHPGPISVFCPYSGQLPALFIQ